MNKKVNKWLEIAERVVNLLRPKTYNVIAKTVVFTGIALIVESQVNVFHLVALFILEKYIGESELLLTLLTTSIDLWIGLSLVVSGLIYHAIITLGKDFIDTKKASLQKYPILEFVFSTQQSEYQRNGELYLDGPSNSFEQWIDIPDYVEPIKEPREESSISKSLKLWANSAPISHPGQRQIEVHANRHLYSDRATLLKEWLGYESLGLNIYNDGEVLASGVEIQLVIQKTEGLSIKQCGTTSLKRPDKYISNAPSNYYPRRDLNDAYTNQGAVRLHEDSVRYLILWKMDTQLLQAGVAYMAGKKLLFKLSKPAEVKCTIYCNELIRPSVSTLTLHPAKERAPLTLEHLTDDAKFEALFREIEKTLCPMP